MFGECEAEAETPQDVRCIANDKHVIQGRHHAITSRPRGAFIEDGLKPSLKVSESEVLSCDFFESFVPLVVETDGTWQSQDLVRLYVGDSQVTELREHSCIFAFARYLGGFDQMCDQGRQGLIVLRFLSGHFDLPMPQGRD
jgi:hypothetical protein